MDYNAFKTKLKELIQKTLGEEYSVSLCQIPKNNGILRESMIIRRKAEESVPAMYLKPYYEAFLKGAPFDELVWKMVKEYKNGKEISISLPAFFEEYEKVSAFICFRLINYEKNREMLKELPHRKIMDLALVYYFRIEEDSGQSGTLLIYNLHIKMWKVTEEELYDQARENTCRLLPPCMVGMMQLIREMTGEIFQEEKEETMFVLTNREKYFGAVCFLYPRVLEQVSAFLKSSFYILPSSIHESIIVPDSGRFFPEDLKLIVQDVNSHYVAGEEVLSDQIYYYDKEQKILRAEK
ncbi:MAG: DUF5688 family protein [Ruminococcus sp.]